MTRKFDFTKEFALEMAKNYHAHNCPNLMWDWLVVWAFYDMYMESRR